MKVADKVFVTSTDSKNYMEVSGSYVADGDTNLDAVIFSEADITLNGTGTLQIVSTKGNGVSSKDDIKITGGVYNINSSGDAIEANDAIRGNSSVQIDGGTINIKTCEEGIEANNIKINGGEITLYAKNDGINATPKVNDNVAIEVNGGTINVTMGSGDTDAFDSNGDIYINGGTIVIEATSAFDSDGTAELNGGNVTVNGETITQITQTQMGGGGKRK